GAGSGWAVGGGTMCGGETSPRPLLPGVPQHPQIIQTSRANASRYRKAIQRMRLFTIRSCVLGRASVGHPEARAVGPLYFNVVHAAAKCARTHLAFCSGANNL